MTINTFWNLFIKALGFYLLVDLLKLSPGLISNAFILKSGMDSWILFYIICAVFIPFLLYGFFVFLLIFKSNWMINRFNLEKGFKETTLDLSFNSTVVLRIITILLGGFILIEGLPALCKELFLFYQMSEAMFREDPRSAQIIYYVIQSLIGVLMMTNSEIIAKFIKKYSSKATDIIDKDLGA
jgi:hypothetical protein